MNMLLTGNTNWGGGQRTATISRKPWKSEHFRICLISASGWASSPRCWPCCKTTTDRSNVIYRSVLRAKLWRFITVLAVDVLLAVTVIVGYSVLDPDITADIKIAMPFVSVGTILFAIALVLRLFHSGRDTSSKNYGRALGFLFAANVLNIIGFTFVPASARNFRDAGPLNVLFIAVDDLRPELGCYGQAFVQSPNIDALGKSGVVFTRAYCQQAVCNPSRASLLTGLRPDTLKVWDLRTELRKTRPDVVTLPQYFKQHGYHTVAIGKIFHNTIPDPISWSEPKLHIQGYPFDPDAVYRGDKSIAWLKRRRAEILQQGKEARYIDRIGQWYLKAHAAESPDVPDNAYFDGAQTDVAIQKLEKLSRAAQPFFLAVGYYRPHLPFNAPKKYWDLYRRDQIPLPENDYLPKDAPIMAINTIRELRGYVDFHNAPRPDQGSLTESQTRLLRHGYFACVSYVDAQVGRLLQHLDRLGLRDSTIVVLWGDHGWKLGEHRSWCKMTNFEIDTRVPLILRVPGARENGSQCSGLVEFVDIYPTLCEATGLPVPKSLEGTSFVPLLQDSRHPWKEAVFSQFLREGIWVAPDGHPYMGYSIRTDRYRYVEWHHWKSGEFAARELYDHTTDPGENQNIASRPDVQNTVAELSSRLHNGWRSAVPK